MTAQERRVDPISTSANGKRRQVVVKYRDGSDTLRSVTRHLRLDGSKWIGRKWNPASIAKENELVRAWVQYEHKQNELARLLTQARKEKNPAKRAALGIEAILLEARLPSLKPERKPNFFEVYVMGESQMGVAA